MYTGSDLNDAGDHRKARRAVDLAYKFLLVLVTMTLSVWSGVAIWFVGRTFKVW